VDDELSVITERFLVGVFLLGRRLLPLLQLPPMLSCLSSSLRPRFAGNGALNAIFSFVISQ
jgi:hypothetical protein